MFDFEEGWYNFGLGCGFFGYWLFVVWCIGKCCDEGVMSGYVVVWFYVCFFVGCYGVDYGWWIEVVG